MRVCEGSSCASGSMNLPSLHMARRDQESTARAVCILSGTHSQIETSGMEYRGCVPRIKRAARNGSVSRETVHGTATSPQFGDLHVCVCRRRTRAPRAKWESRKRSDGAHRRDSAAAQSDLHRDAAQTNRERRHALVSRCLSRSSSSPDHSDTDRYGSSLSERNWWMTQLW